MLDSKSIKDFYRGKLKGYGATAQGMGWKDTNAQQIRFEQLLKIIPSGQRFQINDLGCGTGALIPLLRSLHNNNFGYKGYDPLPEMIAEARRQFPESKSIGFSVLDDYKELTIADYTVASGIFNVRENVADAEWLAFIIKTLDVMNACSTKGFAFNALTKYSDTHLMQPGLYYSDPLFLFDYCKRNFARNVALLHDYELYDFTVLVRKAL